MQVEPLVQAELGVADVESHGVAQIAAEPPYETHSKPDAQPLPSPLDVQKSSVPSPHLHESPCLPVSLLDPEPEPLPLPFPEPDPLPDPVPVLLELDEHARRSLPKPRTMTIKRLRFRMGRSLASGAPVLKSFRLTIASRTTLVFSRNGGSRPRRRHASTTVDDGRRKCRRRSTKGSPRNAS